MEVSPFCLGGNVFGWGADEDTSHAVLEELEVRGVVQWVRLGPVYRQHALQLEYLRRRAMGAPSSELCAALQGVCKSVMQPLLHVPAGIGLADAAVVDENQRAVPRSKHVAAFDADDAVGPDQLPVGPARQHLA